MSDVWRLSWQLACQLQRDCATDSPLLLLRFLCRNKDKLAAFSNYHATRVHIAAPGQDIWSTIGHGALYDWMSGTSMSAPMVAGAAALALAAKGGPDSITPALLRELIIASADAVPALQNKILNGVRGAAGPHTEPALLLALYACMQPTPTAPCALI